MIETIDQALAYLDKHFLDDIIPEMKEGDESAHLVFKGYSLFLASNHHEKTHEPLITSLVNYLEEKEDETRIS